MKSKQAKRRLDRLSQQKHRQGKRSYLTEFENLAVLLAWESGALSEGQAASTLGMDRLTLREFRITSIDLGKIIAEDMR